MSTAKTRLSLLMVAALLVPASLLVARPAESYQPTCYLEDCAETCNEVCPNGGTPANCQWFSLPGGGGHCTGLCWCY